MIDLVYTGFVAGFAFFGFVSGFAICFSLVVSE